MDLLRKNRRLLISIVSILLVASVVSILIFQNLSNLFNEPSVSPTPSPGPSSTPTSPPTISPSTPSPTGVQPTLPPTTLTPSPTPIILQPGEVTQYEGQFLSPIGAVRDNAIVGPQFIDQTSYRLRVDGIVAEPHDYKYSEITDNFTKYQKVITIYCVEGWSATILWEGILLSELLQKVGANPDATVVIFRASDGYSTALPMNYLVQNKILLAYKMNNVTLSPNKGWPFMLATESQYGYKWIKWITQIEVSYETDYLGYWEQRGYPNDASIQR